MLARSDSRPGPLFVWRGSVADVTAGLCRAAQITDSSKPMMSVAQGPPHPTACARSNVEGGRPGRDNRCAPRLLRVRPSAGKAIDGPGLRVRAEAHLLTLGERVLCQVACPRNHRATL